MGVRTGLAPMRDWYIIMARNTSDTHLVVSGIDLLVFLLPPRTVLRLPAGVDCFLHCAVPTLESNSASSCAEFSKNTEIPFRSYWECCRPRTTGLFWTFPNVEVFFVGQSFDPQAS